MERCLEKKPEKMDGGGTRWNECEVCMAETESTNCTADQLAGKERNSGLIAIGTK